MARLLVGLTGGLAAGKSTVAQRLREHGCHVIDADRLVAELYEPGEAGAIRVGDLFGAEVLDPNGRVDRRTLAAVAFADETARRRLEAALHPLVRERFLDLAEGLEGVVVCEAALIVEADWADSFDLVVTVEAPLERRIERAVGRGMNRSDAERRLVAQGSGAARRAVAELVLVNDGDLEELERKVDRWIAELLDRPADDDGPGGP